MHDSVIAIHPVVVVLVTTYMLHSSLLLIGAWLFFRYTSLDSHVLAERVWKAAALGGLITAPLQVLIGVESPTINMSIKPVLSAMSDERTIDTPTSVAQPAVETLSSTQRSVAANPPRTVADATHVDFTDQSGMTDDADREASDSQDLHVIQPTRGARPPSGAADTVADDAPNQLKRVASTAVLPDVSRIMPAARTLLSACVVLFLLFGLVRFSCQSFAINTRLRRCRVRDAGPARGILDALLTHASVRRPVTLLVSDAFTEPLACGLWNHRIVLPVQVESRLPRDELTALLAHELAHLVRRDTVWLAIGQVLCSCFAFQPLNRIACRRWRRAAEYLCDDWAIRHAVDRFSLARCLTRVAEWHSHQQTTLAMLAVGGVRSNLSDRIERLVQNVSRPDPWLFKTRGRLLFALMTAIGTGLIAWGPRTTFSISLPTAEAASLSVPVVRDELVTSTAVENTAVLLRTELDAVQRELDALQTELEQLHQSVSQSTHLAKLFGNMSLWEDQLRRLRDRRDELAGLLNRFEARPTDLSIVK